MLFENLKLGRNGRQRYVIKKWSKTQSNIQYASYLNNLLFIFTIPSILFQESLFRFSFHFTYKDNYKTRLLVAKSVQQR